MVLLLLVVLLLLLALPPFLLLFLLALLLFLSPFLLLSPRPLSLPPVTMIFIFPPPSGITPDAITFNTLLEVVAAASHVGLATSRDAERVLDLMIDLYAYALTHTCHAHPHVRAHKIHR